MPVRNGADYLSRARMFISENILANDEVIIINDNSTDNTLQILSDWARTDSRVTILDNESPGLVNALNLGLQHCSNKWVARFDVDDAYSLQRLERQRNYISSEKVAIFSDYCVISENGKSLGKFLSGVTSIGVKLSLLHGRRTAHPSVLMNLEKVKLAGSYRLSEFPAEDLGLWLRLSSLGEFYSIPETLLFYNLRTSSVTNSKRNLSIAKRNQLINDYISQNGKVAITPHDYDDLVATYRKLDGDFERYLVFCIEVFLGRRNLLVPKRIWLHILWSLMIGSLNQKGLKAYISITQGVLLRWRIRQSFSELN